jgi:hypothetical protein
MAIGNTTVAAPISEEVIRRVGSAQEPTPHPPPHTPPEPPPDPDLPPPVTEPPRPVPVPPVEPPPPPVRDPPRRGLLRIPSSLLGGPVRRAVELSAAA